VRAGVEILPSKFMTRKVGPFLARPNYLVSESTRRTCCKYAPDNSGLSGVLRIQIARYAAALGLLRINPPQASR